MHYVIVFKSRVRDGVEAEYAARATEMFKLAQTMPGLISAADYIADNGDRCSIIEFDTLEHLVAWRDHPEHKQVQAEGRDKFYDSYSISIAKVERTSEYDAATKQWTHKP